MCRDAMLDMMGMVEEQSLAYLITVAYCKKEHFMKLKNEKQKGLFNRSLIAITVIILLIIIGASCSSSKKETETTEGESATEIAETTKVTTSEEPANSKQTTSFEITDVTVEDGIAAYSYIVTGTNIFDMADSEKEDLAEKIYDDTLANLNAEHPEIDDIFVEVYNDENEPAFIIEQPNSGATPKVSFQKYLMKDGEKIGGTFDYDWYDNRYGNGQTW